MDAEEAVIQQQVETLQGILGVTQQRALSLLEENLFNVEAAVTAFFEQIVLDDSGPEAGDHHIVVDSGDEDEIRVDDDDDDDGGDVGERKEGEEPQHQDQREEEEEEDDDDEPGAPKRKRARHAEPEPEPELDAWVECLSCSKRVEAFMVQRASSACEHSVCADCTRETVREAIAASTAQVVCPVDACSSRFEPHTVFLDKTACHQLEQLQMRALGIEIVSCASCQAPLGAKPSADEYVASTVMERMRSTLRDRHGKVLSAEAFDHYKQHRVRCPTCCKDFCTECDRVPYHVGDTCASLDHYESSSKCRFCQVEITAQNAGPWPNVCIEDDCVELGRNACHATLPCGHQCCGIAGESKHLLCLEEGCDPRAKQEGSDYCNICWTEALSAAPCLQLDGECGHVFHRHCLVEKLAKKWPGIRITFGFLECPLCHQEIAHERLTEHLKPLVDLKRSIETLARRRLKVMGMERDAKLTTLSSRFYQKPVEYAMSSFAYYNCYKCKNVYFGGRRDCEQNQQEERPADEFVCYDCCDLSTSLCQIRAHASYHVWKCRFCCSPATWFCWGTTHFCDPCHKIAARVARQPQNERPQCGGRDRCPLKIDHPPNGPNASSELMIGCGLCKDKNEQKKVLDESDEEEEEEPAPAQQQEKSNNKRGRRKKVKAPSPKRAYVSNSSSGNRRSRRNRKKKAGDIAV